MKPTSRYCIRGLGNAIFVHSRVRDGQRRWRRSRLLLPLVLFFARASSFSFAHLPNTISSRPQSDNTAALTLVMAISPPLDRLVLDRVHCQRSKELAACLEDYAHTMNADGGLQSFSDVVNIRQAGLSEISRCPKISKPSNLNPPRPLSKLPCLRGGSLAEFCRYQTPSLDHSIHEPKQCLDCLQEDPHRSLPLHSTLDL